MRWEGWEEGKEVIGQGDRQKVGTGRRRDYRGREEILEGGAGSELAGRWGPAECASRRAAREAETPQGLEEGTGIEKLGAPPPPVPPPPPTFCLGEGSALILLITDPPPHCSNVAHPRGPPSNELPPSPRL